MLSKNADLIGKATNHRKWKGYGKEEGAFQRSGPLFAESAQGGGWPSHSCTPFLVTILGTGDLLILKSLSRIGLQE
jgi:hypothetical protein